MNESFVHLIPVSGLVALVVLFLVLWANPRRLVNQAFAGTFLFFILWTGCIWVILLQQKNGFAAQLPWLRTNTVLAAWMPFGLWLIKEAIVRQSHAGIGRHSLPWIALGVVLSLFSFHPSTFVPPSLPGGHPGRGGPYFVYIGVEIVAYIVIVAQTVVVLRTARGIQRIELQLLTLIFAGVTLLASILNGVGSYLNVVAIKLSLFPMFIVGAATCAWGLCVYRIFNARQILLGVLHRALALAAFLTGVMLANALLADVLVANERLVVSALAAGAAALAADRYLHRLLDIAGKRLLARMRTSITEIARTEPHTQQLVKRVEARLAEWAATDSVALYYDDQADPTGAFQQFSALYKNKLLHERGWATPESLRRQAGSFGELQGMFHATGLGLLVVVGGRHGKPSLFLAFARKRDESPFTYPEIERFQSIAELIENILTRSRLADQAALKAKTEHLAMMSRGLAHDLKNLLTPVSSFLVHTDGCFAPESDAAEVHAAAQRSVRILRDYIHEARFFAERLAPCFESGNLRRLCEAACEVVAARAAARRVTLDLRVPAEPSVVVDAILIQRLLANLIANAIDASPVDTRVEISGHIRDAHLTLAVSDQGCGISANNLRRIFEPYFTTKEFGDEVRGFGLGLTICQKIAALHEGTISVRSALGRGSTFTVELPASPTSAAGGAALPPLPETELDPRPIAP